MPTGRGSLLDDRCPRKVHPAASHDQGLGLTSGAVSSWTTISKILVIPEPECEDGF